MFVTDDHFMDVVIAMFAPRAHLFNLSVYTFPAKDSVPLMLVPSRSFFKERFSGSL